MGMIEAVKALRAATTELDLAYPDGTIGLTLKDAKRIAEALAPMLATPGRMASLENALRAADDRAECARLDLQTLIRLVDFMAAHPQEWAAWKAAHTTTPRAGA